MGLANTSVNIFRNRFIQAVLLSGVFLQIGIWVRNFAVLLFVMDKTNANPIAVSLIYLAEYVPIFLFSFIGGTFADRWPPKKTMIASDLLSALSVFIVLLTVIYGNWQAIFLITFISAILSQFSQPSAMKLFKIYVPLEQLQTAMAIFQTSMSIFMIIGPVLGTLVYLKLGINYAITIMGLAFFLSAGMLTLIPPDPIRAACVPTHFLHDLLEGFKYVLGNKVLAVMGEVFLVDGLAVGIIQPMGIFIVTERLGMPKESLQWLLAVNGAAMLLGGGIVAGWANRIAPQRLLIGGIIFSAVSVVGIGFSQTWVLTLAFQSLNGLVMPCVLVGINTLILHNTVEEFVGRVNGVLNPLFIGGMVLTISISGWLKTHVSLLTIYLVSALLFAGGALLCLPLQSKGPLLPSATGQDKDLMNE
ncbi:MAG TPA: MFS transporter [Syntrophomonadaceae bacterium]|nr:MFS transporter [Syntrophomonadaceae bacterium]